MAHNKRRELEFKLVKKAMVCLLQHVYEAKKERILASTVEQFRRHQLLQTALRMLKIGCLSAKKDRILNEVAFQFREERLRNH